MAMEQSFSYSEGKLNQVGGSHMPVVITFEVADNTYTVTDFWVPRDGSYYVSDIRDKFPDEIEEDALDDKEFQGASLITLLQNAEDFVRNNSKNPWSIRGMTREERSDYPYKAVREVLVNALIHRNYQILGSEIHVEVFDDRLEITSPGGMMNGRRVQDMDIRHIPSMRRNQVISDVFSRLGFMERRGSGIDRILNSYVEVAQKPTFYSDSDFFIVTLPNRSVATPAQVSMESVVSGAESAETSAESAETSTVLHGMSTDAEVSELCKRLDNTRLTASTKERTLELFKRYRYQYQFRSINVAQLYGVQKSRASSIIKNLIKHGLVTSPEYGVYQFVKK